MGNKEGQTKAAYTINLFHTTSSMMINGKGAARFMESTLPPLINKTMDTMQAEGLQTNDIRAKLERLLQKLQQPNGPYKKEGTQKTSAQYATNTVM
jgi:hypothetical protein